MKTQVKALILIPIILVSILIGLGTLVTLFPGNDLPTQFITEYITAMNEHAYEQGYQQGYKTGYASGYNYSQSQLLTNVKNYLANITANSNVQIKNYSYYYTLQPVYENFTDFTLNAFPTTILNQTSNIVSLHLNLTLDICLYNYSCSELGFSKTFNDTVSLVLIQTNNPPYQSFNYFQNQTFNYDLSNNEIIPIYYSSLDSTDIYLLVCFQSQLFPIPHLPTD